MKTTLNKISQLYTDNLQKHGCNSKSVGWRDDKSHEIRFEKLVEVIDSELPSSGLTFNDYGCGYGAMFKFLSSISGLIINKYFGYDISAEMLDAAKEYTKDDRALWIQGENIIHKADYSFVSGTYNVRFSEDDASWRSFILDSINQMAEKSVKGFAFNLLSTYVDWKEDHLYYGDPLYFFDYCKKNIAKKVTLFHDYPLFEWTICVKL